MAVLAVAYGTQGPTLGMAEFAPAAKQALEAPPTTSPAGATGGGSASGRRPTTTAAPTSTAGYGGQGSASTTPTTRVGRARPCFGNPPRQTDDPMSPPCIATIFEGDNGGATSRGVSATEIRVGVPMCSGCAAPYGPAIEALFEYFNRSFEFYGRRLVPVQVDGNAGDSVNARAHAADVASRGVFAVTNGIQDWGYPQASLPQTLAGAGIVTIVANLASWWTDRTLFDPSHPYLWSVYPSSEDVQLNLADFACRSLAGQPAAHAGDTGLRSMARRFGIVAIGHQLPPATRVLSDSLAACSGQVPARVEWVPSQSATVLQTAMAQLRDGGATTLICVCETVEGYNHGPSNAHKMGFHPEWVFTPTQWGGNNDDEKVVQNHRASSSLPPPIRVGAGPRLLPMQARPWFQALQSVRPDLATGPSSSDAWSVAGFYYEQLLVLATGLQAAGPQLSAETFAAGLTSTQFPNPGAGQAPYWQPSAGFGSGDHSLYDDYYVAWWSDTATALNYPVTTKAAGSWCYVGQGSRFRPGQYPAATSSGLFNADLPCR